MPRRRALPLGRRTPPRARSGHIARGRTTSMQVTCGIDWAEKHHDVALVHEDGRVVARARIGADAAGFTALMALLAEHTPADADTTSVPVAIETDKNLLVVALQAAGFTV